MKRALEGFRARAQNVTVEDGIVRGRSDRVWTYLPPSPLAGERVGERGDTHFAAIPLALADAVSKSRTVLWRRDARSFSLPARVMLKPGPFTATPLTLDDAETVNAHWEHRDDVSLSYIRERISADPAVGVRIGDVLIGWELVHDDGAMGAAFVLPRFRRQGVMRSLQFAMVEALRARRLPVFKHISLDNTAWLHSQEKAGWVNEGEYAWFELAQKGHASPRPSPLWGEREALVVREQARIDAFVASLGESELHALAREDALRARAYLETLSGASELELPAKAAFAFRRSVNARTSLLRHTPALEGLPVAFDPTQPTGGTHLVDYARGGYFLFADESTPEHVRFDDHPRLAALARSISTTLGRGLEQSLLFTSGMGAINTVMELLARQPGKKLLGQHAWIEVQEYADLTWPDQFARVDEADTGALLAAMADAEVSSLVLEPLVNHPRSPVMDLAALLRAPVVGAKTVVLDLALTPELKVPSELAPGLTLVLVTSGVKFFQAGWDISKSGLVEIVSPREAERGESVYRELITLRGRSGRVLSPEEAELADLETADSLRSRLKRLDERTRAFAQALDAKLTKGRVVSPWLPAHPHFERARALGTGGRFVYLELDVPQARLETMDRELARRAAERGLPLITATTFGLALPHVCLLAHPTEGFRVRISPGSSEVIEPLELATFVAETL